MQRLLVQIVAQALDKGLVLAGVAPVFRVDNMDFGSELVRVRFYIRE
jgi:hypothetical protein